MGNYVVISPAASKAERNWLPQRYAGVADYIQDSSVTVILCGGPGYLDRETADAIKACVKYPLKDFTGQTTLH